MIALTGTGAIDISKVPTKSLRPIHWDEMAAELNGLIGGDWKIGKVSGRWHMRDDSGTYPGTTGEFTALWKSMSVATGKAVIK